MFIVCGLLPASPHTRTQLYSPGSGILLDLALSLGAAWHIVSLHKYLFDDRIERKGLGQESRFFWEPHEGAAIPPESQEPLPKAKRLFLLFCQDLETARWQGGVSESLPSPGPT